MWAACAFLAATAFGGSALGQSAPGQSAPGQTAPTQAAPEQTAPAPTAQDQPAGRTADRAVTAGAFTYQQVTIAVPPGWCARTAIQVFGPVRSEAAEVRPCAQTFPYLSFGRAPFDDSEARAISRAIAGAQSPGARALALQQVRQTYGACEEQDFEVGVDGLDGIPGFLVRAAYACANAPAGRATIVNFGTFAQARDGVLFVVAFDSPLAPIGKSDVAFLRQVIDAIHNRRAEITP